MEGIKNLIRGLATVIWVLITIAIPVLWIIGAIHSIKKYDTLDNVFSVVTPWGVYRGIEFFYHKDKKIDWNEELKSDTKIMFYIFDQSQNSNSDPMQLQAEIQDFSEHIEGFPGKRLNYLKSAARMYVTFEEHLFRDASKVAYDRKIPIDSMWSSSTVNLSDSLYQLYRYGNGRLSLNQITLTLDKYLKSASDDETDNELIRENGKMQQQHIEEAILDVYYRLFKERYAIQDAKN